MYRKQKTVKTINIAEDFSPFPMGGKKSSTPFSGQDFRETHLAPALSDSDVVVVVLDNVLGYSAAFLKEAFGSLVSVNGFTPLDLGEKIILVGGLSSDRSLIRKYIAEAWSDK